MLFRLCDQMTLQTQVMEVIRPKNRVLKHSTSAFMISSEQVAIAKISSKTPNLSFEL